VRLFWWFILSLVLGALAYGFLVKTQTFGKKVGVLNFVGDLSLKDLTQDEVAASIDRYEEMKVVTLLVAGMEKKYSLKELGLSIDKGDLWFERNNIVYWWKDIVPKIRVEKSFLLVEENEPKEFKLSFNYESGLFEYTTGKKNYMLDMNEIVGSVLVDYGKLEIKIAPKYQLVEGVSEKYSEINMSLIQVYKEPLVLKIKDGGEFVEQVIPKSVLISSLDLVRLHEGVIGELNGDVLLREVIKGLSHNQRKYFDKHLAYENLKKEVKNRFETGVVSGNVLGIDDGPNSDGSKADRYLEVDISQQKMYFFIDGKLFKDYKVSTGNFYPTPVGDYTILNKAPKAYSDIFGVWMPYWMAFKYADDIGAYLGIHELPYVLGSDGGKKISVWLLYR
jgi:hypothetical protein